MGILKKDMNIRSLERELYLIEINLQQNLDTLDTNDRKFYIKLKELKEIKENQIKFQKEL